MSDAETEFAGHARARATLSAMRIPRPRFSLLSLIVMVNVTGLLIWANVRVDQPYLRQYSGEPSKPSYYWWARCRGWPFHYQIIESYQVWPGEGRGTLPTRDGNLVPFEEMEWVRRWLPTNWWVWTTCHLLLNLLVALLLIGLSAYSTELLVCKLRKSRPTTPDAHP